MQVLKVVAAVAAFVLFAVVVGGPGAGECRATGGGYLGVNLCE